MKIIEEKTYKLQHYLAYAICEELSRDPNYMGVFAANYFNNNWFNVDVEETYGRITTILKKDANAFEHIGKKNIVDEFVVQLNNALLKDYKYLLVGREYINHYFKDKVQYKYLYKLTQETKNDVIKSIKDGLQLRLVDGEEEYNMFGSLDDESFATLDPINGEEEYEIFHITQDDLDEYENAVIYIGEI